MTVRKSFILISIILLTAIGTLSIFWRGVLWSLVVIGPLFIIGLYDLLQKKHSILRNFPLIGHGRYMLEKIRPEIMQYFVETDTQGKPFNRIFRTLIYQRAKDTNDTVPFGTLMDVYEVGYEWLDHSLYALNHDEIQIAPRRKVGGPDCTQPYMASLLNISAMSFGSLSANAIMALNKGAVLHNFAHNTGEGGISPYHKKYGGDLIWQIGTGYFGCRQKDGSFCFDNYKENANLDQVKMIELKLSQGAKPGHGGILPARKNTPEIASIRLIKPYIDVISPPTHSAFSTPVGMLKFIAKLRDLSGGKPVGFKLCIGKKEEFSSICKAMLETGIKPDFITVDGGEGGTGAAPVEFSNSLGMPMRDAVAFAYNTLQGYDLKKDITLIASGKISSGFNIARAIALGADMVNSARAMMMAIGCIQALQCNQNTCPVGVTTQDKSLMKGLHVENKAERVANYHRITIESFMELIAAAGFRDPDQLERKHINCRIEVNKVIRYDQMFPSVVPGSYLHGYAASAD